jgi:DNA polymerase III sliding clamp (beta) subunit (PCNA family)
LFTIVDATNLEKVEKENERHKVLVRLLKEVEPFKDFLDDSRDRLEHSRQAIASKDEHRELLCGVCLDSKNGQLRVRATDGIMFIETLFDSELSKLFEGKEMLVSHEGVKKIELILKSKKKQIEFECSMESGLSIDTLPIGKFTASSNCANFPNTDQIKPSEESYDAEIAFNAEYLLKLAKACEGFKRSGGVKLKMKRVFQGDNPKWELDTKAPILVKKLNSLQNEYMIVMPMRF